MKRNDQSCVLSQGNKKEYYLSRRSKQVQSQSKLQKGEQSCSEQASRMRRAWSLPEHDPIRSRASHIMRSVAAVPCYPPLSSLWSYTVPARPPCPSPVRRKRIGNPFGPLACSPRPRRPHLWVQVNAHARKLSSASSRQRQSSLGPHGSLPRSRARSPRPPALRATSGDPPATTGSTSR